MIDLAKEDWFTYSQGKRKLPTQPSYWTVHYWCHVGRKAGKKRIKMESIKTAHGWATSVEAYYRFQAALCN